MDSIKPSIHTIMDIGFIFAVLNGQIKQNLLQPVKSSYMKIPIHEVAHGCVHNMLQRPENIWGRNGIGKN